MTTSEHINEYFNGKAFMLLCAVALVAVTAVALVMGVEPAPIQGKGIFFSLQGALIEPGPMSAGLNVLCLLATGAVMLALNKVFTYIRSMTHLFVSAFFLLQIAHPPGLVVFNAGTLLSMVTALAAMPLFASYQDRHAQRSVFLIFAIVAAGSMFHYGFLVLLPAFVLGFLNMGVLNLKGLLAMLFGLVTPFWIVLGLRLVAPADFVAPDIHGVWELQGMMPLSPVLILAALTAVLGIVLAVMNLMTIMNYRMQTRVYNAFFVFVLVAVVVALCLDCHAVAIYLPLLGLMTAVQLALAYTLRGTSFRYVFILLFIACCFGFAGVHLLMP